ncbi:hypothetical protein ST37_17500 [Vibrio sp. qd031]|uniref:TonB-dependent receptor domain-containing protein n=1 Tax=Vibrio sp. qd031 TaxID=1603038 RepID=UPI000A234DAB|nr:TonB-dependent receptor [Vibrio sp. qd031]ORT48561.1 hypothetical protein ST37_17500 [Vibrio sp. qd031]
MKITPLASKVASLCLCAPLFTSPFVFAQDTSDEPVELQISYAANRMEQPKTSVLASIDIIEREDIEKMQADSVYDVIATLPGVEIVPQGTKGSSSTGIFLRGTETNKTLILVNGARVNKSTSGTSSIGLIPAFAIEKIEVIRGPRAAIYGSDAMGGVIAITTIPESQQSQHEVELAGGSNYYNFQGWKSSGQISDNTFGHFIASREADKGYDTYSSGEDENYGYSSQSFFGGIEHTFTERWSLAVNGYYQSNYDEYQGYTSKDKNEEESAGLASALQYARDNYTSSLSLDYTSSDSSTSPVDNGSAPATVDSKRTSFSWFNSYLATNWLTVNGGLDHYSESAHLGGIYNDFDETNRDNTGIYASALFDYQSVLAEASLRHDESSAYGGNTTWNAALGYYFSEYLTASASYGTAFVAPTFADLYWPMFGNPDLKPQESDSVEFSLKGKVNSFDWSATAYHTKIQDLIVVSNDTENIDNATIKGIELDLAFSTGDVNHRLVADLKDPVDESDGSQLIRRAKQNYTWQANYTFDKFDFVLISQYIGERKDNEWICDAFFNCVTNEVDLDAYLKVDFGATYRITPKLKTTFKVDNLFDKEYAYSKDDFGGYIVGQERSYYAGINYLF